MWIRRGVITKTVVSIASKQDNLHHEYGKQLGLLEAYEDVEADSVGRIGDTYYDVKWTAVPDNYPQPSTEQLNEQKIQAKIKETERAAAVAALIASGGLPPDHVDTGTTP